MAWIKRNIPFVIGLVVALAMVGVGIFYLLAQMERASTATADLESSNRKLDEMLAHDPFPEPKNIAAAKAEQVRLQQFQAQALGMFQTNYVPKDLDSERFQLLLLSTLAELERAAAESGTKLPAADYSFTFTPQKGNTQIPVGRLGELAAQINDIRALAKYLFSAKIHALSHLKRAGTSTNDYGNADILTEKKTLTDPATGAVLRQYEVQFQSFSGEVGAVLSAFANAPETIVVRALNIQRGNLTTEAVTTAFVAPAATFPGGSRMDPALAARYGLNRPAAPQPAAAATTPTARPGEPVVDEKPVQVTLALDIIKLAAPGSPAATPGAAARSPRPATAPAPVAP